MRTFTDALNRRWAVAVNAAQAAAVKETLGMDLPGLLDDGMARLSALLSDPRTLGALLYALCSFQAVKSRVTPGEFALLLEDPVTAAEAAAALGQALFDAYAPAAGYVVCRVSRHDRARVGIIRRAERSGQADFSTVIPRPPDPSVPRVKGSDPELPRRRR